jgi:hypothetical protein
VRRVRPPVLAALVLGPALGCGPEPAPTPLGPPSVSEPIWVVPGAGLPPELTPDRANNNLDVVRHEGRVYLAFRTAPGHFAHPNAVLHVVSSEDQETWRHETRIALGTDVREPRFLSWQGRLHLYFALLGTNAVDFEPGEMRRSTLGPDGWSTPVTAYVPGFIPWRAKVVDGRPWLIGYDGGENVYDLDGEPIRIHLLTSDDGVEWRGAAARGPVVSVGGGSESDVVKLDDGRLIAVVRNEAGDALGWGSKICTAPAHDVGDWSCVGDKRKYDSPLMFRQGEGVVLVARRNLNHRGGDYDLGSTTEDRAQRTLEYLLDYSERPKRCAVWRVDPDARSVEHLVDLPSAGDTCFASVIDDGEGGWWLYNYSSPLDDPDISWLSGQRGRTSIYRVRLRWDAP